MENATGSGAPVQPHPEHPHSAGEVAEQFADAAKHAVEEANKRAGRDIFAATGVGIGLLVYAGASLLWFPWGFAVLAAAAVLGGQIELARAIRDKRGWQVGLVVVTVGSVAYVLGAYAVRLYQFAPPALLLGGIVGLTMVAVLLVRLRGPIEGYVADVMASGFLLLYPALLVSAMMFMLAAPDGPGRIATFVIGVAACDTGGYAAGVLAGKHRFAPRISPKKSWEGVAGSLILTGVVVALMTVFVLKADWWKGAVIAAVMVIFSIFGDLVESVIKRDLGIKDMGTLVPGHGGVMDRIDSYILSAVPVWLTMAWLLPYAAG